MRVKEESERDGLKLNIKKTKKMVSRPITSRQIEGKGRKVEVVTDSLFLGSKTTADGTAAMKSGDNCFSAEKLTDIDSVL